MTRFKATVFLPVFALASAAISFDARSDDMPSVDALIDALSKKSGPTEKIRSFAPSALEPGSKAGGGGQGGSLVSLQTVEFEYDSATLTDRGRETLDRLAEAFQKVAKTRSWACPDGYRLVGHTDATGSDGYNMSLSYKRAESARAYLKSRGVQTVLNVEGKGKTQLKDPAHPADGVNRRVEIDCGA
jgi:OOP family OmpA-OmpF porin